MSALQQPNASTTLMKAFNNACDSLGITREVKSKILGVNISTLSRKNLIGFDETSKTAELQCHFIRLYRSLFAISGGDNAFMNHWFTTENKALNGTPALLCQNIEGLFRTNQYLDAMRGKV